MKYNTFLIVFFACTNSFAQTNYYVDKINGNDTNLGTSVNAAWKTIQKAANTATPNSIVNIKAASYYENVEVNVSGTTGNLIVFKNYQNDFVAIDGTGTTGTTLLKITNKSYLKFENITIQNKTANDAQGILVETTGATSANNLTFKNIRIQNINWTASASTIPTENNNAQGFIAYGRNGGITNLTLESCQIFNNILGFSEALAINGNIDGFLVKNCVVHDNSNIGICLIGHEGTSTINDEARNGLVVGNICYNNISLYATSAGIYVDGANSISIEKNKCYQNGSGIEIGAEQDGTAYNITVKNNLIFANQQTGLAIGGYDISTTGQVVNCKIRNNSFYKNNTLNDGSGEIAITKASNCVFENNIFYTNAQNVLMTVENINPQTGNSFNYNHWFTPNNNPNDIDVDWRGTIYSTFASYKNGTSQDTNSDYGNPLFISSTDYYLQATSNCINSGNPATQIALGETDYNGYNRIANTIIDKGAFEYASTLGFEDFSNISNVKIYPNPAKNILNIHAIDFKNTELNLYNLLGELLLKIKIKATESTIDISDLSNGLYFVTIISNNKFTTSKLIITH